MIQMMIIGGINQTQLIRQVRLQSIIILLHLVGNNVLNVLNGLMLKIATVVTAENNYSKRVLTAEKKFKAIRDATSNFAHMGTEYDRF